jgi:hypothetical protein
VKNKTDQRRAKAGATKTGEINQEGRRDDNRQSRTTRQGRPSGGDHNKEIDKAGKTEAGNQDMNNTGEDKT